MVLEEGPDFTNNIILRFQVFTTHAVVKQDFQVVETGPSFTQLKISFIIPFSSSTTASLSNLACQPATMYRAGTVAMRSGTRLRVGTRSRLNLYDFSYFPLCF
jgi:hypothetical protein